MTNICILCAVCLVRFFLLQAVDCFPCFYSCLRLHCNQPVRVPMNNIRWRTHQSHVWWCLAMCCKHFWETLYPRYASFTLKLRCFFFFLSISNLTIEATYRVSALCHRNVRRGNMRRFWAKNFTQLSPTWTSSCRQTTALNTSPGTWPATPRGWHKMCKRILPHQSIRLHCLHLLFLFYHINIIILILIFII